MADDLKKDVNEEKEMSFWEHLDELRQHIFRALYAITIASVFAFFASDIVFGWVLFGPIREDFPTYRLVCWLSEALGMGDGICFRPVKIDLETFDLGEAFSMHLKISFFAGLALSFPFILWELWKFIRPALYINERQSVRGLVFWGTLLFAIGMSFGYFILAPFSINFFAGYQLPMINQGNSEVMQALKVCAECCGNAALPDPAAHGGIIKASSFINYMLLFTFPVGLVFELPILIYYLATAGIVTPRSMREYRRHAIVGILIVAAIVTPPDVVTQIIVAIPMYILYELSIGIAARQERKYKAANPDE